VPSERIAAQPTGSGAIAVTGSKGGVGKSNLVANLAVSLARWGRRVLLVDGDLGLANLDVLLGLLPRHNVDHVMSGDATVDDVLVEGPHGVRVLPAASGVPELASIDARARARLLAALAQASAGADHVLVDTGAGLGDTTLALQLAASSVVVVTTAEPTSLVDAYATLKVLWSADPRKHVDVVVNNVPDDAEAVRAYEQVAKASDHFLGQRPGWLGAVVRDPKVEEAVRRQRCLMELYPDSPAGRCYERIALRLTLSDPSRVPCAEYWHRLMPQPDEEWVH
jgi:flagellar biosynthesis protein FlhG